MKEKINLQSLFIAALLILAGIISPSNGVDDTSNKTPQSTITTAFLLLLIGLSAYVAGSIFELYTQPTKTKYKSDIENPFTSK